jgi:ribose-phosphate pyrophosphokinase
MPYFPYSRQSKKKQHRGAITARMVANLLHVAGVNHVITLDLHASQMQGFFKCPVDNLVAEPLLARWIRVNVPNWREAVVVSKNPGGTKRVTSLADALKLSFGIVTTDRRRAGTAVHWNESAMFEELRLDGGYEPSSLTGPAVDLDADLAPSTKITHEQHSDPSKTKSSSYTPPLPLHRRINGVSESIGSPLSKSMRASSIIEPEVPLEPIRTVSDLRDEDEDPSADESAEEYTDEVCFPCLLQRWLLTMTACTKCHPWTSCTRAHCRRFAPVPRHFCHLSHHLAESSSVRR